MPSIVMILWVKLVTYLIVIIYKVSLPSRGIFQNYIYWNAVQTTMYKKFKFIFKEFKSIFKEFKFNFFINKFEFKSI